MLSKESIVRYCSEMICKYCHCYSIWYGESNEILTNSIKEW